MFTQLDWFKATEKSQGDSKSTSSSLLGKFVTAEMKGREDTRQGWVLSENPLIIKGQTGILYECEGTPRIVINPPIRKFA